MIKTKEQKLNNKMQLSKKRITETNHVITKRIASKGITLIALVITIVLNCSFLAMVEMNK